MKGNKRVQFDDVPIPSSKKVGKLKLSIWLF